MIDRSQIGKLLWAVFNALVSADLCSGDGATIQGVHVMRFLGERYD